MKVKAKESVSHSVVSNSLQPHGLSQCARLLCPWSFSGKNTEVGSHFLLQRIFPTQGLNLGPLHCRWILYRLNHQLLNSFGRVQLFLTPWTVALQAPLSMGFSRQEYWSGLPCPPPGDLPNPGIKPVSFMFPHWQAGSLPLVPGI